MPVTAKLSLKFYERLGDDIANELVAWFNAVDETYQRQLKDVNDLNWQRVETRLGAFDERLSAMSSRFNERLDALSSRFDERLEALSSRFDERLEALSSRFDEKLEALSSRFDEKLEALSSRFDERLEALSNRFDEKLNGVATRVELDALEARVDAKMQRLRSDLILWMFGFWTATLVPLVGLMLALSDVFRR